LKPEYQQIVERISNALNQVKGQIVVIGHTDNVPLRSIQYPSNWHLSKGRAQSVVRSIAPKLIGDRSIIAEGRGESEPIAPNDTPANKALNRRVEIVVKISS
jgi:type VI secretion system protein ImpK